MLNLLRSHHVTLMASLAYQPFALVNPKILQYNFYLSEIQQNLDHRYNIQEYIDNHYNTGDLVVNIENTKINIEASRNNIEINKRKNEITAFKYASNSYKKGELYEEVNA